MRNEVIFPTNNCDHVNDFDDVVPLLSQTVVAPEFSESHFSKAKLNILAIYTCPVD